MSKFAAARQLHIHVNENTGFGTYAEQSKCYLSLLILTILFSFVCILVNFHLEWDQNTIKAEKINTIKSSGERN